MSGSLFNIPDILGNLLGIAQAPEIGAESRLFISEVPTLLVGTITQTSANAGTFVPSISFVPPPTGANGGNSMQIRCKGIAYSTAAIVLTLGILNEAGAADTAAATLGEPQDDDADATSLYNFPAATAADLVAAPSGNPAVAHTINSITGVTSIAGGQAGNVYEVVILPDYQTFTEVNGVTKKDLTTNTARSLAIADRFNATGWVKKARSEVAKFEATAPHCGHDMGLARLDGMDVTVMLEVWKEDTVLTERIFLDGWHVNVVNNRGDGNPTVEDTATGMYLGRTVFSA